ncbi:hypothetical protein BC941DRAFT_420923 [Chlamydoabsidia padenii]|nr:hypothetical protein BC941DRAFT_420923 [Chlamydoabsidia padenii]
MWRKEQHFVTIHKTVDTTPAPDNTSYSHSGSLPDSKSMSNLGSTIWCCRTNNNDGTVMYQGQEFDVFKSEPTIHTNPDDDPCTSRASTRLSINTSSKYGPPFLQHCPSINNKRKAQQDLTRCDKHCRLDNNTRHLGTLFFLHTSPRGAPVDLFKPSDDKSSNCFCTQHTIYS